jgi:hypothetical protein
MLEEACNQKEEKDARIEELEEQVESLQQHRDQLAKDITSLQGKQHGQCRYGYLNRVDFNLLEQSESLVLLFYSNTGLGYCGSCLAYHTLKALTDHLVEGAHSIPIDKLKAQKFFFFSF